MSYTPPSADNVDFTVSSYTAPAVDNVDFTFDAIVITDDGSVSSATFTSLTASSLRIGVDSPASTQFTFTPLDIQQPLLLWYEGDSPDATHGLGNGVLAPVQYPGETASATDAGSTTTSVFAPLSANESLQITDPGSVTAAAFSTTQSSETASATDAGSTTQSILSPLTSVETAFATDQGSTTSLVFTPLSAAVNGISVDSGSSTSLTFTPLTADGSVVTTDAGSVTQFEFDQAVVELIELASSTYTPAEENRLGALLAPYQISTGITNESPQPTSLVFGPTTADTVRIGKDGGSTTQFTWGSLTAGTVTFLGVWQTVHSGVVDTDDAGIVQTSQ